MTPTTARFGAWLAGWDRSALGVLAAPRISPADMLLRRLTRAANHSRIWFTVAAVLACTRGRPRRAALRGVAAIAGTSLLVNAVVKPATPRLRPAHSLLPHGRALAHHKRPSSSSFPSGHAASAAAFTTAVAMEFPLAGAIVAPVAALVGYSRVHVGVHWPSDVVTGAAIGAGVAFATHRWWPVRGDETATASRLADLPDLGSGAGLLAVVNPGAGSGDEDPAGLVAQHWPAARVLHTDPETDLVEQVCGALDGDVRALAVAGGDGTVAAVASVAAREDLPLLVVPAGTLNHFARDNGIEDIDTLVEAVRRREGAVVDLGSVHVDDQPVRWFINTASVGGYPDMVRLRERWQQRWGKWPAAAAALIRVLWESEPLAVRIDGRLHQVWLLFVGNGRYRPRGGLAVARADLDSAILDVRYVRADLPGSRSRFVVAALCGAIERSRTYVQRDLTDLELAVDGAPVALATDGEVATTGRRFRFTARPDVLAVYRPEKAQSDVSSVP